MFVVWEFVHEIFRPYAEATIVTQENSSPRPSSLTSLSPASLSYASCSSSEKEANQNSGGSENLEKVVREVQEVSSLPSVAAKVIEVCNDPNAGAAQMRKIVEGDPALSARVIKCVNSAAYGLRKRVTSLQRAISYLGFKQIRNLALTASVAGVFQKSDETVGNYKRAFLWRHMVSVAVVSRMVAARQKMENFEDVFLAGLLHDLGIVLEDQYCHGKFVQMMEKLEGEPSLCEAEQKCFGFDHTELGLEIATRWKFSDEILDTIRYHHNLNNYRGEHKQIVACVDVANLLCSVSKRTSVGVNLVKPNSSSLAALGLMRADLRVLTEDLEDELRANKELFDLLE